MDQTPKKHLAYMEALMRIYTNLRACNVVGGVEVVGTGRREGSKSQRDLKYQTTGIRAEPRRRKVQCFGLSG